MPADDTAVDRCNSVSFPACVSNSSLHIRFWKKPVPVFVSSDNWLVEEGDVMPSYRLSRTYHYSDPQSSQVAGAIRFFCAVDGTYDSKIRTRLYVFVRPLPLQEKRSVLLGLYAARQGGTVQVVALPNFENNPLWLDSYLCVDSDAVFTCLRALQAGTELTFVLSLPLDLEAWSLAAEPARPFLEVSLPNGSEFHACYNEICSQIERSHRIASNTDLLERWPLQAAQR